MRLDSLFAWSTYCGRWLSTRPSWWVLNKGCCRPWASKDILWHLVILGPALKFKFAIWKSFWSRLNVSCCVHTLSISVVDRFGNYRIVYPLVDTTETIVRQKVFFGRSRGEVNTMSVTRRSLLVHVVCKTWIRSYERTCQQITYR